MLVHYLEILGNKSMFFFRVVFGFKVEMSYLSQVLLVSL